ncbi:MAG: enoyl-CoA hydratase/isomerase family protein [Hyphomicrobiales bacterium]|nr:enoyl-CoA hydratase/isomerase family protein [Hyphomicrobiales bacterium]MBV9051265.1 enoyl-CoA hydratase/isomerase family protein [Hyphomicrobiales bacterium]MBV9588831.1 enoyl-CoA hydratase/isomerase family protein [Hyphomicrobiales bacterium]MBV9977144.1 enoyl-CoA hydratase/isomerase family protein [Hyphomicrobiales bacterium]
MTDELVLYETEGLVGTITMNRPEKLNALSKELREALVSAFRRADEDAATSVVVLRAEGRSFCAGYDIGGVDPSRDSWRHDALRWHAHLTPQLEFEMMPWYMRKPVIASVQGHAVGGGCELAMYCDLTIAAENAKFGEPEVRFSNTGPGLVMPWIIGYKRARELLYFGDLIDAETALRYGMINAVVPLEELREATRKYASRLALVSPEALVATKLSINRGADLAGFRNAMQAGLDVVAPLYAAKTEAGMTFKEITKEKGLGAALKWRGDQFKK